MSDTLSVITQHLKLKPYMTVTNGMRGWFAVLVVFNQQEGFYEPFVSSPNSYTTKQQAIADGLAWAQSEDLQFQE